MRIGFFSAMGGLTYAGTPVPVETATPEPTATESPAPVVPEGTPEAPLAIDPQPHLKKIDPALDVLEGFAAGADGTEAAPSRLGLLEEVEIDLDVVDLLHAADVRVPVRLVRIEEGAGVRDAGGRMDDLVAVDAAAPALGLLLRPKRKLCPGEHRFPHWLSLDC